MSYEECSRSILRQSLIDFLAPNIQIQNRAYLKVTLIVEKKLI